MPAIKWIELYESNDLIHLSKTGKICKRASLVLDKLQDEIIDSFGASKEFLAMHQSKIELELLLSEKARTKDESLQFDIDMAELEIQEQHRSGNKKADMYSAIAWIKKQGINIDENTMTVFWYYKYMEFLSKQISKSNGGK